MILTLSISHTVHSHTVGAHTFGVTLSQSFLSRLSVHSHLATDRQQSKLSLLKLLSISQTFSRLSIVQAPFQDHFHFQRVPATRSKLKPSLSLTATITIPTSPHTPLAATHHYQHHHVSVARLPLLQAYTHPLGANRHRR